MAMKDLKDFISHSIKIQNNTPLDDFEGYSANDFHFVLYDHFNIESPVQLREAEIDVYTKVPFLNQIRFLLQRLKADSEIKLTAKGYLPTKIVAEIYGKGFLREFMIDEGYYKLYKETDALSIHLTRIILQISNLVKKRNNKISLTRKGLCSLDDDAALFKNIFETFTIKFNWSYNDAYENEKIGQMGFGFTIILLDKYGQEYRDKDFYAEKYFKAFNFKAENPNSNLDRFSLSAYKARTFDRFLNYFGLLEYEDNKVDGRVKVSKLFSEIFNILPPRNF